MKNEIFTSSLQFFYQLHLPKFKFAQTSLIIIIFNSNKFQQRNTKHIAQINKNNIFKYIYL